MDVPPELVARLLAARTTYNFPSKVRPEAQAFAARVLALLFPHFASSVATTAPAIEAEVREVKAALTYLCEILSATHPTPADVPDRFVGALGGLSASLTDDAQAIFQGDPAARTVDEVILTYPGLLAIAIYRIAHQLHVTGMPLVPRLLTEFAHEKTGIDIHPGARIGRSFCIDHGTGVVIGETCDIGSGVKIYQGVTLGAATVKKELSNKKRHPTIGDAVVIYAGATILGGDTVVGHDSLVAGNAWMTESVPPFSVVTRAGDVRPRTQSDGMVNHDFMI